MSSPAQTPWSRQPALSRLVLREMAFYGAGAQAGALRRTREALIDLIADVVRLALARRSIATAEPPEFVGWTVFCIYQVELRRWLAQDRLDLRAGTNRLRRALALFMTGLAPSKTALRVGAGGRRGVSRCRARGRFQGIVLEIHHRLDGEAALGVLRP